MFDTGVDDREVFGAWEKGSTCDRYRLIKMLDVHNLPLDMMCFGSTLDANFVQEDVEVIVLDVDAG